MNYRYGSNSASRECLSSAQLQPVSCEQRDEQGPSIALVTGLVIVTCSSHRAKLANQCDQGWRAIRMTPTTIRSVPAKRFKLIPSPRKTTPKLIVNKNPRPTNG